MDASEEKLKQEIQQEARLRSESALARARQEVAALLATADAQGTAESETRLAVAEGAAAAATRAIVAGIPHAIRTRWALRREQFLTEVFEDALRRLETQPPEALARSLVARLAEAVAAFGAEPGLVIHLPPALAGGLPPATLAAVARQAGGDAALAGTWQVLPDPALPVGGLLVLSQDGRRRSDHCFAARLVRDRDGLRRLAAEALGALEMSPPQSDNTRKVN